jgi:hypothetical protein
LGRRSIQILALAVLAAAALYLFGEIYSFSQTRFFTVDEYQFGHATWLITQGQLPYVDFFEHHFPLSYVLHAPFLAGDADSETNALLLRKIVFRSWVALSLLAGWACFALTRERAAAVLAGLLPLSFGFSLMSAIDYRADNFGAIYFAACLVLLEWNRQPRRRSIAVVSAMLGAIAVLMTQKMAFVAAGTLACMLAADLLGRLPAMKQRLGSDRTPFIAEPLAFFGSAIAIGLGALALAAALGLIQPGFEATVLQALEHELYYDSFSIFEKGYVTPFFEQTWPSTLAILLFAVGFFFTRAGRFWIFPVAVSLYGASLIVAPYPYNFVFLCWIVVLAGVRGFTQAVAWLRERVPALEEASPLLFLLPLVALPMQVGFVADTISNEHQLALLRKIDEHGERDDAVIDSAGGAMFSPHASYYWYHGNAHRQMFRDYFESQLIDDFRASSALFWIRDMRFAKLPKAARDYLQSHYIQGSGDLHVLGIRTPPTGEAAESFSFDVVRSAAYHFRRTRRGLDPGSSGSPATEIQVDGKQLAGGTLFLDVGVHEVVVAPHAPGYVVAPVEASFFEPRPGPPHYSMMFQYREPPKQPERAGTPES